ncbi:MAG: hypothetical protein ACK56F_16520 [bacterium]
MTPEFSPLCAKCSVMVGSSRPTAASPSKPSACITPRPCYPLPMARPCLTSPALLAR